MSGIALLEMEAADMVDIFHYLFEEDNRYSDADQVKGVDEMRSRLYRLYGTSYDYGSSGSSSSNGGRKYVSDSDFDFDESDPMPYDGKSQPVKSYVAPTEFNPDSSMPFGGVLDAPLG